MRTHSSESRYQAADMLQAGEGLYATLNIRHYATLPEVQEPTVGELCFRETST
ncbi:hypothetical protein ACP70R_015810 [Stipagrostis hirtigluma subsp. patula]